MPTVSATHAKQNFAAILDQSQREPVRIKRHDRDVAVLISAEEYDKIHQLRVANFLKITEATGRYAQSQGMTDQLLAQMLAESDE